MKALPCLRGWLCIVWFEHVFEAAARSLRGPDAMAMRACGYFVVTVVVYVFMDWTKTCVNVPQTSLVGYLVVVVVRCRQLS